MVYNKDESGQNEVLNSFFVLHKTKRPALNLDIYRDMFRLAKLKSGFSKAIKSTGSQNFGESYKYYMTINAFS